MVTNTGSTKAAGVRKLFKRSAHSFTTAVYPEDNPADGPRRSSRRDSPPR
jgi:hypothetical protein